MRSMVEITDEAGFMRTLRRLAHEILEDNPEPDKLLLIGILRRGATMTELLADMMKEISGTRPKTDTLDITLYRDDLLELAPQPSVSSRKLTCPVTGKNVVLVDDVIFTGRTARAAMDAVIDAGRPKRIRLAVMIDRGHRELPIRPDYVGKNVPTAKDEQVKVLTETYDGAWGVCLLKPEKKA